MTRAASKLPHPRLAIVLTGFTPHAVPAAHPCVVVKRGRMANKEALAVLVDVGEGMVRGGRMLRAASLLETLLKQKLDNL